MKTFFLSIILGLFSIYFVHSQNITNDTLRGKKLAAYIQGLRQEKDAQYKQPGSPLAAEDTANFKGLNYFPVNDEYRVMARFIKIENPVIFRMKTTTDRRPEYAHYADVVFQLQGKEYKLEVYQNIEVSKRPGYEDYLFLPFSDETSGRTSYGGGRFLDLRIPKSDTIIIDFNQCYNPYCAYNHRYSCPIPPEQNDLPVKILASEKNFN